jgi:hypothetical protein
MKTDLSNLLAKMEAMAKKEFPYFYVSYNRYEFMGRRYFHLLIAPSNYLINMVQGQYAGSQIVVVDENLEMTIHDGAGGIYREVDKNNPSEKMYAMIRLRVPFRRPKPEEGAVLRAHERFLKAYRKVLEDNVDVLRHKDEVDYKSLLKK